MQEIVRGWTAGSARSESPRGEWLGERERERVRLVREWVQTASQQRDARTPVSEEARTEQLPRLRGRQARHDLITRIAAERQRELQRLSEHRVVSEFSHRNRIQSLLRGRFLRNGRPLEDERPPSVALRELGQLRQRHPVSGLREGFRYRLENIVRGQANGHSDAPASHNVNDSIADHSQASAVVEESNDDHAQFQSRNENAEFHQMAETNTIAGLEISSPNNTDWQESVTQRENWREEDADNGRMGWQHSPEDEFSEWRNGNEEESDRNWNETTDQEWAEEVPEDGEDSHILEAHEEWREDESHETVENWHGPSPSQRGQQSSPNRRVNRFVPPEDDNVYSMELRELLSRRSVSNLLHSQFRESLDQLIQSYVQRQDRAPLDWEIQRTVVDPDSPDEDQSLQRDDLNQDQQEPNIRPQLVMSTPPVPPPQPLWHSEFHRNNWPRPSLHRSEIEWDISDLRADISRLQQGMNHMQRMLEACMDMQLELQRSVRQEVSAALNRSVGEQGAGEEIWEDGSKWAHVKKGTCCVCCDSHIDALLYRCGHMCTCSKCANELVRSGDKCPLCRAPIAEVIRAYSIL